MPNELEVVPAETGEPMKRAESPAIWTGFQGEIEKLIALSETVRALTIPKQDGVEGIALHKEIKSNVEWLADWINEKASEL